jgi:hypothetical protein
MPSVYEYATSEASNSATGGWNTAEGMDPSAVNDGMRVHKQNVSGYLKDQGAVNTVGGSANAITVTLAAAPVALVDGYRFTFNATAANTGNTTLNVTPAGGSAFGAKKLLRWDAGSAIELPASSIPAANALTEVIYDSARDSGNGAFMLLGSSVAAATTSAAGIVELATLAETLAGTDTSRAVVPANLYFPTGHLYGLTLSNNVSDATNDIDIAAGTARDASDSYNYILTSAYTKQIDAAWALGTAAGGLDTGSVGNNRYAIWGIGRSDTRVCDVLFSTSFSSPTMPTNYDFKVLLGEFTRAGGVNGPPLWYGPKKTANVYALTSPHVILEDQKAQNTSGGTFTSGADRTRDLNTEVYDPFGLCTLSSNQFTLSAGTYYIDATVPCAGVDRNQAILYNATGTAQITRGTSSVAPFTTTAQSVSYIRAVFTVAASQALEIRHRCQTTGTTVGFGVESNFGTERYTRVCLWRIA